MQYFDDTLRLGRVFDLVNRARVQREFEDKVVADAPQEIERRVSELIDWLVDQDYRQWQAVSSRLADRQREHGDRILTHPEVGSFNQDRTRLLQSVGREAQRVVDGYDRRHESQQIADGARTAVAATAAVGAGAVGLGALVSLAATTAAADVTGLLMASVMAVRRVPDHSSAPAQGADRDPRTSVDADRRTWRRARRRVPEGAGAQRPTLCRRHWPVRAVRPRRALPVGGAPGKPQRSAQPDFGADLSGRTRPRLETLAPNPGDLFRASHLRASSRRPRTDFGVARTRCGQHIDRRRGLNRSCAGWACIPPTLDRTSGTSPSEWRASCSTMPIGARKN